MGGRGGGSPGRSAGDWRDQTEVTNLGFSVRRPIPALDQKRLDQVTKALREAILDRVGYNEWAGISNLRDRLSAKGFTVGEQDAGIKALAVQPKVLLIPIANLKSLTRDDFRSAVFLGNEFKHAMMIER